ncbi:MAG TPA: rod shape-determining protein MreC [Planctomycetaceae bacterium]|nr:rod shape-determining protein MreC [Planctomycetaceae bacterium]
MSPLRRIAGSPAAVGLWSVVLGAALWFAPQSLTARMHAVAWDGLRPGLQTANLCEQQITTVWMAQYDDDIRALRTEIERLRTDLAAEQSRTRRLTAQILTMRDRELSATVAAASAESSERLFLPAVIDATVLGDSLSQAWRQGTVLDRGWKHGLREAALVLQSSRPLIDRGQADQLSAEDMLLLGQSVLGKIDTVGRWTSTFLPITDPAYRGRAQLVRDSENGPQWGATGLLRGDGHACRLDGVPGNESVRVGDLVLTADRDAALGTALSYGTVVDAHLGLDDREWQIVVQPSPRPTTVTTVQVLRTVLNPARLWTQ